MNNSLPFQNQTYLRNVQYKTGSKLSVRAELHQRYSTASLGWQQWVFQQLELEPASRILECGCGPGWLWRENLSDIPADTHVTLTDLSAGMVEEAESALNNSGYDFQFETADIQDLPFADDSLDVVIANHMLYHVPNVDEAIMEVKRVLRENGRFFAATNGAGHLRELWQLGRQLFAEFSDESLLQDKTPQDRWHLSFSLENGTSFLAPHFTQVDLKSFADELIVTEAEPIVAYLDSSVAAGLPAEKWEQMTAFIQQKIDHSGSITIHKETGLFIAC